MDSLDSQKFRVINFFCVGDGMTCGPRQAGIDVIAGVDFDAKAPSIRIWMRSFFGGGVERVFWRNFLKIDYAQEKKYTFIDLFVGCGELEGSRHE